MKTKNIIDDYLQLKKDIVALKRGNTALLEALMDMCAQYLANDEESDWCSHGFMSAGEGALSVLAAAGAATTADNVNYLLDWPALERRKKELQEAEGDK